MSNFDLDNILKFVRQQSVADFIVIGRLQRDELIPWNRFQERKIKYNVI